MTRSGSLQFQIHRYLLQLQLEIESHEKKFALNRVCLYLIVSKVEITPEQSSIFKEVPKVKFLKNHFKQKGPAGSVE